MVYVSAGTCLSFWYLQDAYYRIWKDATMIYLIGSLRNPRVRQVALELRRYCYDVFDDWHACGAEADSEWSAYEKERGRSFQEALASPFAQHAFDFDLRYIQAADVGVLVLPAGKSGHLELGYMIGRGQRGYILLDGEPEGWDLMYSLAHGVFSSVEELLPHLK
jgi:hypothetical protein